MVENDTMQARWADGRRRDYEQRLSWGWTPTDAAWSAYFGKPFYVIVVTGK